MLDLKPVLLVLFKPLVKFIGKRHGAVLSACTADTDHKLVFSLNDIIRDQEIHHIFQFIQKIMRFVKLQHIILYFLVISVFVAESLHIVRIWQETHVKYQIGIRRDPVLKAKGEDRDKQVFVVLVLFKDLADLRFQFPVRSWLVSMM